MKNTTRRDSFFFVALISVLIAIGLHLYLNKHHVDVKLGISSESSMCNVSEKLNCDAAASSSFSEVFGIPVALLGVIANVFLLILLGLIRFRWTEDTDRTERYAFYFASFVFGVSVVMGSISMFVLKVGCPFCIATYVASLVTVISLWLAFRPSLNYFGGDLQDMFTSQKWIPGTLLALVALGYLVNNMVLDSYGYQKIKQAQASSLGEWQASPVLTFDESAGLSFQNGTETAKVVVVEFADFLCSHCRDAYQPLHSFAKKHADVKFIYKPFPLDGVCNSAIQGKRDGKSCELAYATLCAEKVGQKGWATHHYIFDNQEQMYSTPMKDITERICKETGVDCAQLQTCMASEEIHELVKRSAAEGEKAQIGGTPSVFFNNRHLPGGQLLPVLEHIYQNRGNL